MKTGKNKSTLKNFLLEGVRPSESTDSKVVVNGRALLRSCSWSKGDTFVKLFHMYINKHKRLGASAVVFAGYETSTKDANHNVRSGKMSQVVKIIAENSCPFDRVEYLTNYANKQIFVNELTGALELERFQTVLCPSNANTTTVRPRVSKSRYWQMTQTFFVSFCIIYFFPTVKRKYY